MSTTTAAKAAPGGAAGAAADKGKKTTVPKDVIARLNSGDDPEDAPGKEKGKAGAAAAAAGAAGDGAAEGAAGAADDKDAAAEAEKSRVKRKTPESTLPPIPEAPAAGAPITEGRVREIVAEKPGAGDTPALKPEDQNDLQLAQFASKKFSDKYADLPTKLTKWFGVRDEHLAAKAKELGGQQSQEFRDYLNSSDLQAFVRENAPTYQRGDSKKVYEEYLKDQGAQETMARIKPELNEIQRKQKEMEEGPKIMQQVGNALVVMLTDLDDKNKDEALVEASKDLVKFAQENEVEGGVIVRNAVFFREAMEETLRITSGLAQVDPAKPSPTHQWIDGFIGGLEQRMEKTWPNGLEMKDGKIIVTGEQMKRLQAAKPKNLAAYRMLTPVEIVSQIAIEGQSEIKRQLKIEREKLERSGFVRQPKKGAEEGKEKKAGTSEAAASPMAGSSAARGAAAGKSGKAEKWFEKYTNG